MFGISDVVPGVAAGMPQAECMPDLVQIGEKARGLVRQNVIPPVPFRIGFDPDALLEDLSCEDAFQLDEGIVLHWATGIGNRDVTVVLRGLFELDPNHVIPKLEGEHR